MSLLLYCLVEIAAKVKLPAKGVAGAEVRSVEVGAVRCFYSQHGEAPKFEVKDALAFHRALDSMLAQATIMPFRFPMLLETNDDLLLFLDEQGSRYADELARLRDTVQMELHIEGNEAPSEAPEPRKKGSGRAYLAERKSSLEAVEAEASRVQSAVQPLVLEWRQSDVRGGIRCYALTRRETAGDFRHSVERLEPATGVRTRLSGPWPPTAFLEPES